MSKRTRDDDNEDQRRVRAHYDNVGVHAVAPRERRQLSTAQVRELHNWLKGEQYALHVRRDSLLLDICAGKGGDLGKAARAGVRAVVLVDSSRASLLEAQRRYECHPLAKHCAFIVGDVTAAHVWSSISLRQAAARALRGPDTAMRIRGLVRFPAISCQFALHYAFVSEVSAMTLLRGVASQLSDRGIFFGIVANGDEIARQLRESASTSDDDDKLYRIRADNVIVNTTSLDADFGSRYYFTLVDGAVVDVPEYITRERVVRRCADAAELECLYYQSLRQLFTGLCRERPRECAESLRRRRIQVNTIDASTWQVAQLYSAFAFRRRVRSRPTRA